MIIIAVGLSIIVLCTFITIRSEIIFRYNKRAIKFIFSQPNWKELEKKHNPANYYFKNLFDLTKWTYNQMFPGL